ncbi:MAG TPA: hypothetical protein VHL78_06825 [Actinomycetota bacterium]|nr:hypothetical protein [Actinomycetota bacterium]
MTQALLDLGRRLSLHREDGAIGWVVLGIVIGIGLIVFAIIKFLIPGD